MSLAPLPQPARPDEPANDRLSSWKEIASYLHTTVRTVQRWEKSEQLPVHRHLHAQRHSVYAFKAELDGWWQSRGANLKEREAALDTGARYPALRRGAPWAAALLGVLIVAGLAFWGFASTRKAPEAPLKIRSEERRVGKECRL